MKHALVVSLIFIYINIAYSHSNCVHDELQKSAIVNKLPSNHASNISERKILFQTSFLPLRMKFDFTYLDNDEDSRQCTLAGQVILN
jgi:hypothetical protein